MKEKGPVKNSKGIFSLGRRHMSLWPAQADKKKNPPNFLGG